VFNSSAAVVSLRLFGAGAGFATQLVLARLLSPADLGMFFSVTSLAAVTGLLVVQGYPNLATRFVARYRNNPKLLGVFIRESTAAGRTWAVLAVAILLLNAAVWPGLSAHDRAALAVGALTVLPIAALNIHSALAGAMRRFDLCYGPESLLRPVGFLAAVALAATLPVGLSLETALVLFGAITLAIAVLQGLLLRTSLPAVPTRPPFQALARRWRREARALVPVSLFTALFADVALVITTPLLTKAEQLDSGSA
jgi:O-antigen/teichoic acid export membrane protein